MRRSPAYSRKTPGNDSRIPHAAYAAPGNGEDPRKYRAFRPKYAEATLPDTDSE